MSISFFIDNAQLGIQFRNGVNISFYDYDDKGNCKTYEKNGNDWDLVGLARQYELENKINTNTSIYTKLDSINASNNNILADGSFSTSSASELYKFNISNLNGTLTIKTIVPATASSNYTLGWVIKDSSDNIIISSESGYLTRSYNDTVKLTSEMEWLYVQKDKSSEDVFNVTYNCLLKDLYEKTRDDVDDINKSISELDEEKEVSLRLLANGWLFDNLVVSPSSTGRIFAVNLRNYDKVNFVNTIMFTASTIIKYSWVILDKNGNYIIGSKLSNSEDKVDEVINIIDNYEWLLLCTDINNFGKMSCKLIRDIDINRISEDIDDINSAEIIESINIVNNDTVYDLAKRFINTKLMSDSMNKELLLSRGLFDAQLCYDDNYFYIVGWIGSDVWYGTGGKVMLRIYDKANCDLINEYILGENNKEFVDISNNNTATMTKGASMPNLVIKDGNIIIVFTTVINDNYTLIRCLYNIKSNSIENYSTCFLNSENFNDKTLLDNFTFNNAYINPLSPHASINLNARYIDSNIDGVYYVGLCSLYSMTYPVILKTSDFINYEFYKELKVPLMNAAYECTTLISDNRLYCATRQNLTTKSAYTIIVEINLTNNEIDKIYKVPSNTSRPCLFKVGTDVYLAFGKANDRYSGSILQLNSEHNRIIQDYQMDNDLSTYPTIIEKDSEHIYIGMQRNLGIYLYDVPINTASFAQSVDVITNLVGDN